MKNSKKGNYALKKTHWGFKTLSPLPNIESFSHFYKTDYYKKLLKEGKTREAKLIQKNSKIRKKELDWVHKTYFADRLYHLRSLIGESKKKYILDVGCGTGEFLQFMKKNGWNTYGIEPSYDAWTSAKKKGGNIFNISLEDFVSHNNNRSKFDAVTLLNVLEHIPYPQKVIVTARKILKKGGVMVIQVPNDFNALQNIANQYVRRKKWWVTIPDHVNYFNFDSLERMFSELGFRIKIKTTDFPMETFLLMGENYVDEKEKGASCHEKRMRFELRLPADIRRGLYIKLASFGLGRQCIIYAQKI